MSPCTFSFFVLFIKLYFLIHNLDATDSKSLRAQHGEYCNKTLRCDSSSFLSCRNSVCECQKADVMFYDPVIKSCLVLVGEKCKYHFIKGTDEFSDHDQLDKSVSVVDELDCVQNAWCNRSGFCMCAGDYIEISNGTCISQRSFGESCTTDGECRQDQFLNCTNAHCSCNDTTSTYNVLIRQCVGKAGKPCIGNSAGCVYNADCVDNSASSLAFAKRRMRKSVQICSCNSGFVADSSGFCRVGLGGQCSNSRPCASGFKCKDNQCVCPYENVQVAMTRGQVCLSLAGGPCNETVVQPQPQLLSVNSTIYQQQTFQCVENSQCVLTNNETLYECQCNDGFVASRYGSCDLAYGSSCNDNTYSVTRFIGSGSYETSSCDRSVPLYCIDGICQCASLLYEYDLNDGACLGKYGANCFLGRKTLQLNTNNETANGCIYGAECVMSRDVSVSHGKCICSKGFIVTGNRTCLKMSNE